MGNLILSEKLWLGNIDNSASSDHGITRQKIRNGINIIPRYFTSLLMWIKIGPLCARCAMKPITFTININTRFINIHHRRVL